MRAFDSVPFSSVAASLSTIRAPEAYTRLIMHTAESRFVSVNTDHGRSPAFQPGKDIEQGEVNAPFLWKIFYDPLLTRLSSSRED